MGEQYCRGCGHHVDKLGVTHPMQCPKCHAVSLINADYCGHCGKKLPQKGGTCACRKEK
jgi:hypothetical protein